MKKHVITLAALATLAGAAAAQSSATVFGLVDLNIRHVKNDQSTWQLGQDGMAGSRLGFRGIEDMGGGLKASFWLEGQLGPDTGTGNNSFGNGNAASGMLFQRRSTLSLSNQWGELRLGRDYTPTFWNIGVFDPFGVNGLGSAGNLFIAAEIRSVAGAAGAYGTLVRANNSVQYILPNGSFGPGLYGQLMVAAGENAPANKFYSGRVGYAQGAFDVAAAYGYTYVDAAGNVTAPSFNLGGSWNFGVVKVSGFYGALEINGLAGGDAKQDNWFIAAVSPIGQWNLKASYGQVKQSGRLNNVSLDDNDASQIAVGVDYNLSKRTALYATASWIDNNNTAYGVTGFASPLTRGNNSSGAEFGIRHSF
jgi:predicted porin